MRGLMQDKQLVVTDILEFAAKFHSDVKVVTQLTEGGQHEYTYADALERSKMLALALQDLGVKLGDRVGTLAWNNHRHYEAWYGIMGIGAICHTLNPRLFPQDLIYIANHAEDSVLMIDITFIELVQKIRPNLKSVKAFIVLTDREHMPKSNKQGEWICFEDFIAPYENKVEQFAWPYLDENTACGLCYTSGTTGRPKGVLYSHRSNFLQALIVSTPDAIDLRGDSSCLAIVPMFHANSWGLVFAAPMQGTGLILPGPNLDGKSICDLIRSRNVSITAGVPTVVALMLQHCEKNGISLKGILTTICVGGAACPPSMIRELEEKHGVTVRHLWGMTETSPIGTVGRLKAAVLALPKSEQRKMIEKQGRPHVLTDMRIVSDDGKENPKDGKSAGTLQVRGPLIVKKYFRHDGDHKVDKDGWFDTGDVATLDSYGHMQIVDRSKDVIKSGGEWISSIDVENVAVGCPGVQEAAVIGVPHPKWTERPLLVVIRQDPNLKASTVLKHLQGKIAKWWIPEEVVFVKEIPHTATGKISKLKLREQLKKANKIQSKL